MQHGCCWNKRLNLRRLFIYSSASSSSCVRAWAGTLLISDSERCLFYKVKCVVPSTDRNPANNGPPTNQPTTRDACHTRLEISDKATSRLNVTRWCMYQIIHNRRLRRLTRISIRTSAAAVSYTVACIVQPHCIHSQPTEVDRQARETAKFDVVSRSVVAIFRCTGHSVSPILSSNLSQGLRFKIVRWWCQTCFSDISISTKSLQSSLKNLAAF